MHCAACRSSASWRATVVAAGLADVVEFQCPRGLSILPERGETTVDPFSACDGCPHHVLAPPNDADACALLGGKPCALNERIRDGGPWPLGCRRLAAVTPQSSPTTDSGMRPEPLSLQRQGCCGEHQPQFTTARNQRTVITTSAASGRWRD